MVRESHQFFLVVTWSICFWVQPLSFISLSAVLQAPLQESLWATVIIGKCNCGLHLIQLLTYNCTFLFCLDVVVVAVSLSGMLNIWMLKPNVESKVWYSNVCLLTGCTSCTSLLLRFICKRQKTFLIQGEIAEFLTALNKL